MDRSELIELICTTLRDLLADDPERAAHPLSEETRLYGPAGLLDSLRLVSLVLDLEQELNDRFATELTLADSRAMSQQRSPFRSIGNLADYIAGMLAGSQRAAA
jgi:acyl carrier protein